MFTLNEITLRPLEPEDADTLYEWYKDSKLEIWSGWSSRKSLAYYKKDLEELIMEPKDDYITFGIEKDSRLVGRIELALIDRINRHAAVGLVIGDKNMWGKKIGSTAVQIMLDYAFKVENLHRVFAEVYGFNTTSRRFMEKIGFQHEGVLRQHEYHNGELQDMHIFGMLREDFYEKYGTIFKI